MWKQTYLMADDSPSATGSAFGEVECRAEGALCQQHGAGQGGWPTIKYFNKATGPAGARYVQKTTNMVCDELKQHEYMQSYVDEKAGPGPKVRLDPLTKRLTAVAFSKDDGL